MYYFILDAGLIAEKSIFLETPLSKNYAKR